MGEIQNQNQDELTFPTKRKLDPPISQDETFVEREGEEDQPAQKTQKLETLSSTINNNHNLSFPTEKEENPESQTLGGPLGNNKGKDFFVDQGEEEEEEDGDYEEGDEEDEAEEGAVLDKKGKGILIEEKDVDDSSDDDDDDGSDMDADNGGSELEEDPLAEVDLDNILPSRTRSRRASSQPGIFIGSSDVGNDDSDDSDA